MQSFVGTSGYAYKEWKGHFYPEQLASDEMLRYYAQRFKSVEINNTFYRMPSASVVRQWASQVPDGFTFVLKASRRITHLKRLRGVSSEVDYFVRTAAALGPKLGPVLFQLPPNFKRDLPRLVEFLALVPRRYRAALEFRHSSWFDEDVNQELRSRNVALVVADTEEAEPPMIATANWGYLRLRREAYTDSDLECWAARVRESEWEQVFVFFKHEDEGVGPKLGMRFAEMLEG
jgi:uncharacterized protein YecE (DUF72 family)